MPPEAHPRAPVVITAARNEADRIGATLDALAAAFPGARLFVADDASEDGTAALAKQRSATVISRPLSRGKGANVTAAAEAALAELGGADATVLLCDADLGESARELPPLVEAVEGSECELAIAAFARREGGGFGITIDFARDRIEALSGFHAIAPISGQRAMPASLLDRLLPFADGFGMELGMTIDAVRAGARVKEIELPLAHRATGRTIGGFAHRARQLWDIRRAVRDRARSTL